MRNVVRRRGKEEEKRRGRGVIRKEGWKGERLGKPRKARQKRKIWAKKKEKEKKNRK